MTGGFSARRDAIEFDVALTNDTDEVVRDVVARAFLDDEEVSRSASMDVFPQTTAVTTKVTLKRPDEADLAQARNNAPTFHGRRFSVRVDFGKAIVIAPWPDANPEDDRPSSQ